MTRSTLAAVVRAVALAGWPLLAAAAGFWLLAVAGHVGAEAGWLYGLAWQVTLVLVIGALGSFAVHECGHVVALLAPGGVDAVAVERTWLRISVTPVGDLTPRRVVLAALAGPGAAALVGLGNLAAGLPPAVGWLYLAHLMFLLPVFGDGRVVLAQALDLIREAPGPRTPPPQRDPHGPSPSR